MVYNFCMFDCAASVSQMFFECNTKVTIHEQCAGGAECPWCFTCECSKLIMLQMTPYYRWYSPSCKFYGAASDLNAFQAETSYFLLDFHRITLCVVWDYVLLAICFIICKIIDIWDQCWLQREVTRLSSWI